MGNNFDAILTAVLLVLMIGTMALGRFSADIIMMGVLLVLLVAGVLGPDEAIAGFANQGVITVAMLYIVAAAMKETGAMARLTTVLIGRPKDERSAQIRLTLPVAAMSAFINNTPIVAMFLPTLAGVARRCRIAPSKLYMPLSFASILGGVCTLIGTSTNVIVAKLLDSVGERQIADVILDLTGVVEVDPEGASRLNKLVRALQLLGASARIAGIRAEAAQHLIDAGIDFDGVETLRSLAEALRAGSKTRR